MAFCATALIGGILTALAMCSSVFWRSQLGILFGRGPLLALVNGCGIYKGDILRATQTWRDSGRDNEINPSPEKEQAIWQSLIVGCILEERSSRERIPPTALAREYNLLQSQFWPQRAWVLALNRNGLSAAAFRRKIAQNLRAQSWIERQIREQTRPQPEECLRYYEEHLAAYRQPIRYRASHLFLAAPPETPPEDAEAKRVAIDTLWQRLNQGETFSDLVAAASEDEATKTHGGDLGFFSEGRMLADFFAHVKNMPVGDFSGVIRTRLGFHIVQLTDSRPAVEMSFERARSEIYQALQNQKRTGAVEALTTALFQAPGLRPPPPG